MFVEICIRFLVLSAAIRTAALRETTANEACTFKKDGFFYDSRVSQYSRWIVEKKLNVSKEADCGSECCLSGRNCTLYVFSQRNLTPNCVVISCHNNTECFENLLSEKRSGRHFVRVGIRDNINITSPHSSSSTSTTGQSTQSLTESTKSSTQSHLDLTSSSHKMSTSVHKSPLITELEFTTQSTSHTTNSHAPFSSTTQIQSTSSVNHILDQGRLVHSPILPSSSSLSLLSSSSLSSLLSSQVSRITAPIASQLLNKQPNDTGGIQNSSSDKQDDPTKKPSEQTQFITHSHTTPASLVISLIIGILFFGAVVFLIGRRWGEVCYRKGYSRVDYLLNDYE